ncbi:ferritin-like domain-containing protein [Candidatus Parcubacteria bacterium]|nr:ferritin-like domain-containing protein [Candidatus Parcubacteria bacterium]
MENPKELMVSWLQRAHAMEESLIDVLQRHAEDAKGHPEIRVQIEDHLTKTRNHSELVRENLERLGGDVSTIKEMAGEITGALGGIMGRGSDDMLVKNAISDYAAENLEMASYNAILSLARTVKDRKVISMCRTILKDEKEMAKWLEKNLPGAVQKLIGGSVDTAEETEG